MLALHEPSEQLNEHSIYDFMLLENKQMMSPYRNNY